jgi:hypothetical protein
MATIEELEKRIEDLEECIININTVFERVIPIVDAVPTITDSLSKASKIHSEAIITLAKTISGSDI